MGTFCIVLGILIIIAGLLMGHVAGCAMSMDNFINILGGNAEFVLKDFLMFPGAEDLGKYLVFLVIFLFIGFMIGMGVLMSGLIYRKLQSVEYIARRAARKTR